MTPDEWLLLPLRDQLIIKRAWMDYHNERSRNHRVKRNEMQM